MSKHNLVNNLQKQCERDTGKPSTYLLKPTCEIQADLEAERIGLPKMKRIKDELEQYSELGHHLDHYVENIVRIILDIPTINYLVIPHDDLLAHSCYSCHRIL